MALRPSETIFPVINRKSAMKNSTIQGSGGHGGRDGGKSSRLMGWVNNLFSRREIYNRVEEDFPTWQEYSNKKLEEAQEREDTAVDLPPHRVFISSPLQWNFLFFLLVAGSLGMGYAHPQWGPYFIYGAILFVFLIALLFIIREGIFFHFEGQRLEQDCEMINKNKDGPEIQQEPAKEGFWRSLVRRKKGVFRSTLLQIHYQNVLRTFQQGNRRARVDQESSISDIHTLLSQRGMKLVWTFIEVLPQLGLLGTLVGLARMFFAFSTDETLPELAIIAGFGTALGTTILANLFVLILRPLFMRNERAMYEILSALQMLMATFILPTQNYVLGSLGTEEFKGFSPKELPGTAVVGNSGRLVRSMESLATALKGMKPAQRDLLSEGSEGDKLKIASEMKAAVESIKEARPIQVNFSNQALTKLTETMQSLTQRIDSIAGKGGGSAASTGQISHELTQLRMLNHDTLILMDQLANHLEHLGYDKSRLLSQSKSTRAQVFSGSGAMGDSISEISPGGGKGKPGKPPVKGRIYTGR